MRIAYFGGTINKSEQLTFKRLLFRATRGKAYSYFFDIHIPDYDRMASVRDHEDRVVYIVVFEEGGYLNEKVKRICLNVADNMFEINRYEITS